MSGASPTRREIGGRDSPAFTLVELLVALAILAAAMAIAWGALSVSLTAWRRGDDLLGGLRRGENAADELAMALRSAFFRPATDGLYGFELETNAGDPPSDTIRWTSLSGATAAAEGGEAGVPRRLTFMIERDDNDRPRAVLRGAPIFARWENDDQPPPVLRAWPDIVGFACRVWNPTNETWDAEWANTNAIPASVEIALYAVAGEDAEPVVLRRRIALPLAAAQEVLARDRRARGGAPLAPELEGPPGRGRRQRPPDGNDDNDDAGPRPPRKGRGPPWMRDAGGPQ